MQKKNVKKLKKIGLNHCFAGPYKIRRDSQYGKMWKIVECFEIFAQILKYNLCKSCKKLYRVYIFSQCLQRHFSKLNSYKLSTRLLAAFHRRLLKYNEMRHTANFALLSCVVAYCCCCNMCNWYKHIHIYALKAAFCRCHIA